MSREHGTSARYVWGPDENGAPGAGCRCEACRAVRREEANTRNRPMAYGRWQPYVDSGRAREHLRLLAACGIGWKRAAVLAGIGNGTVSKILYGTANRPPTRRIRPQTEAAILAIRPSLDLLPDGVTVDAAGTQRRMKALVATGWSQQKIARRLGMTPGNFGDLLHNRAQVTAATARAARALYDDLWNQPPPQSEHRDKIAANRARNYARANGWPPPGAWDDDRIDDPAAAPAEGWRRRERLRGAEMAAEARELTGFGLTRAQAAERLGVTARTLEKTLCRHRGTAGDGEAA